MAKTFTMDHLVISTPDDWEEITNPNSRLELVRNKKVGKLCVELYSESGESAVEDVRLLEIKMKSFMRSRELKNPFDMAVSSKPNQNVAASFRVGDDFHRFWLLSNGLIIVTMWYSCPWSERLTEADDCKKIAQELNFAQGF